MVACRGELKTDKGATGNEALHEYALPYCKDFGLKFDNSEKTHSEKANEHLKAIARGENQQAMAAYMVWMRSTFRPRALELLQSVQKGFRAYRSQQRRTGQVQTLRERSASQKKLLPLQSVKNPYTVPNRSTGLSIKTHEEAQARFTNLRLLNAELDKHHSNGAGESPSAIQAQCEVDDIFLALNAYLERSENIDENVNSICKLLEMTIWNDRFVYERSVRYSDFVDIVIDKAAIIYLTKHHAKTNRFETGRHC